MPPIVQEVPSEDVLGETPLWCVRTQSLLWLDIDRATLNRHHPASGRRDSFRFNARALGSMALRRSRGVVIALDSTLHTFEFETGRLEDHQVSWSLYFSDPDGNPYEITSYEYGELPAQLR
jgi:sugar lactone lactonase YvrE